MWQTGMLPIDRRWLLASGSRLGGRELLSR
jgi:hypothetical protein